MVHCKRDTSVAVNMYKDLHAIYCEVEYISWNKTKSFQCRYSVLQRFTRRCTLSWLRWTSFQTGCDMMKSFIHCHIKPLLFMSKACSLLFGFKAEFLRNQATWEWCISPSAGHQWEKEYWNIWLDSSLRMKIQYFNFIYFVGISHIPTNSSQGMSL